MTSLKTDAVCGFVLVCRWRPGCKLNVSELFMYSSVVTI
jgi:hypothetical protein